MPRRLLLLVLLLVPILALASLARADDADAAAKEALRRRLCAAFRTQKTVHHALRWEINSIDQEPFAYVTEYFQEGERAGMRSVLHQGEDIVEYSLFVTDGESVQWQAEGVAGPSVLGARRMNTYHAPYFEARQRLSKRWSVPIPCPRFHLAPHLQLEEDGSGPGVFFRLTYTQDEAPAGWLRKSYFDGLEASLLEEEGLVRLRGRDIEGTLRLDDGLPVSWSGRNPRTGGTAKAEAVATRWGVDRWQEEIKRLCSAPTKEGAAHEWEAQVQAVALDQLLDDVFEAVPDVLDGAEKLDALIRETVTADLARHGPAAGPPDLDEAVRAANRALRTEEIEVAFRKLALEAGWSEVAADALGDRGAEAWRAGYEEAKAR